MEGISMETPTVSKMRSLNIGLSILIYEDILKVKELEQFTEDELDEIRIHSTRECIKKGATKLLRKWRKTHSPPSP